MTPPTVVDEAEGAPERPGLGTGVMVGAVLALLAATCLFAWYTWVQMGDVSLSWLGLLALAAFALLGVLLGVGLMRLCYLSSRRGYDDAAGQD